MPSNSSGNKFFINEFDESIDHIMLDIINSIFHPDTEVIELYINSDGGDVYRAFAVVELISLAKARGIVVETFVLCSAHSAGSLVAVAGSPGNRWVAREGNYLLHYGQAEQTATGPVEATRMFAANIRNFDRIANHYNEYANIPELREKLESDAFYIFGEEAVKWNMADGFIEDYE